MSLQEVHFFERLYSELNFGSAPPTPEEIINFINSSRSTHLIYTNLSTGETLEGPFYLENSFLVYYHADKQEPPRIVLDVSYARIHMIFRCSEKVAPKINLEKNQNTYEIGFDNQNAYEDWMLRLRKYCILTNFDKKYQVTEVNERRGDICECLLEAKTGGNHFSAKKFDKKQIISPENSLTMIHLINDIEILRALRAEKILHLNEVYETEDSIYLVTDFVHNITLKKMLKAASSPFSETKTRSIMQQILTVLACMASKKIVHKNLKPSNIMMESKKTIRIINFGLASYVTVSKSNMKICGTPGYIAPEILNCQNENRVYNEKSDIFSAGCIFFEMLFGYPLFKGAQTSEISTLNKHFKYPDLVELVTKEQNNSNSLSNKLSLDLLLKLLHNDPKQRISAEEALDNFYFDFHKSLPSSHNSSPRNSLLSTSPQNSQRRISFDISPNHSPSISLSGSFSEAVSSQESTTLYPSTPSTRKCSEDYVGRCTSPSRFKNQPRFKSAQEMELPVAPIKLNGKFPSETLILQRISFTNQNEDNSDHVFDESSPTSLPKNKKPPGIKKTS